MPLPVPDDPAVTDSQAASDAAVQESGRAAQSAEAQSASAQVRAMDIPLVFPEVNRAERERLLQREAALDARLLKRAEIEAAERVAREDRAARELSLERERAREREAAALATPGILVIQPSPFPRPRLHRPPPLPRGA